jgi:hypothetical protein
LVKCENRDKGLHSWGPFRFLGPFCTAIYRRKRYHSSGFAPLRNLPQRRKARPYSIPGTT